MSKTERKSPVPAGLRRSRPVDDILSELRVRLRNGEIDGCMEWVRRLSRREDLALLRGLVEILADHVASPPRGKRGRPKRSGDSVIANRDGTITIDRLAVPLLTERQLTSRVLSKLVDLELFEEVTRLQRRYTTVGAIARVAVERKMNESAVRAAYYRVK